MNNSNAGKTAFVTYGCLYQFHVMPFELCYASATFQRLIESGLSGLNFEIRLLYLKNSIVYSESFEQHLERLPTVY